MANNEDNKVRIQSRICYDRSVQIFPDHWLAYYKMSKPVGKFATTIILRNLADNEVEANSYRIARHLNHVNLLRAHAMIPFEKNGVQYFNVVLEEARQTLADVASRHGPMFYISVGGCNILKSSQFIQIVRELIEALCYLHGHGKYHGNLTVHSTYIAHDKFNSKMITKLAKFNYTRVDDQTLMNHRRKDWQDLGNLLVAIAGMAEPRFSSTAVDKTELSDLASFLKSTDDIDQIKSTAFSHTFFWQESEFCEYLAVSLPVKLHDKKFCDELRNAADKICELPWQTETENYSGLVNVMKHKYNKDSIIDFLKFLSASYNHFGENATNNIKGNIGSTVTALNNYIMGKHPDLCHKLFKYGGQTFSEPSSAGEARDKGKGAATS